MTKGTILFSGGLDSTVLLFEACNAWGSRNVYPLTLNYGQVNDAELVSARRIVRLLGLQDNWANIDLSQPLDELLKRSEGALVKGGTAVTPKGYFNTESRKAIYVPNRNGIMLSLAWAFAQAQESALERVGIAIHAGAREQYPDCTPMFIKKMEDALLEASQGYAPEGMRIWAPYVTWMKDDIIELGNDLGVPFESTFSCHAGGTKHCGECGACLERKEGFQLADVRDPTDYMVAAGNLIRGPMDNEEPELEPGSVDWDSMSLTKYSEE